MEDKKWCSIIIPVYNIYDYLRECVQSILDQNDSDIEILLVDDGSKDKSGELCDLLATQHECIRVIHKENGGLSDARNAGVKQAKGKYLLFVDGDDYIKRDSLIKIHSVIVKNNYPDIVCLECNKFFTNSNERIPMNDGISETINHLKGDDLYNYIASLPKYPASACTKAIRRDFFLDNSLFFVKGLLSEDLEWAMRLFTSIESAAYCPADYYMYRQTRSGSITNTVSEKNVLDLLAIFSKGIKRAKNSSESGKRRMLCSFTEFIFRLIALHFGALSEINRKRAKLFLKRNKWILGKRKDIISKLIAFFYFLFGIEATSFLMKKYMKMRS